MDKSKNVYDKIARIAYDLYENRGRVHGYDLADWIEAEKNVMERHAKEIEQEAEGLSSTKRKKASSKTKPKTLKSSQRRQVNPRKKQ